MARVEPVHRSEVTPEVQSIFSAIEVKGGIVPNSMLTMARIPALLQSYAALTDVIFRDSCLPSELKRLAAFVSSHAAGCIYCASHNSLRAENLGSTAERLGDVWVFETSPHYSDEERAVLRVAREIAQSPSEVTNESISAVSCHYGVEGAVELIAVLSMTAFTNRWNTAMATDMESAVVASGRVSELESALETQS